MAEPGGHDLIRIRGLEIAALIGVEEEERRAPRKVLLDLTLFTATRAAARSDDLADTVDYQRLGQEVRERVAAGSYRLLERLAEEAAEVCLRMPLVAGVRVRAGKPGALPGVRAVEVEITRMRGEEQGK
jgi:dihydroneopterin aldolase